MKERYQNPVIGDELRLRLLSYNSNAQANVDSINKIDIYFLDPTEVTDANPDGRRLVQTIDTAQISNDSTGAYSTIITVESELYTIGNYLDIWEITLGGDTTQIENSFSIYPNLWFTTTTPITYDFNFSFRPNRIRKGSIRWLTVEINPNVPNQKELISYYTNLAIIADISVSIEQECGDCVPAEEDLRSIVDEESIELREKCLGYYRLDTSEDGLDMAEGIYNIWFTLQLGDSTFISEKQQLQIV